MGCKPREQPVQNGLADVRISVEDGSGLFLEKTDKLLFSRGDPSIWGADVDFKAGGAEATVHILDSDGDMFLTVRSKENKDAACVFDVQLDMNSNMPRANLFQRNNLGCRPVEVKKSSELGIWTIKADGDTAPC